MTSPTGRLRLVGLLEGISLLLLVGIAVPAKHLYGNPQLVRTLGPVHGLLFLLFIFNTLHVGIEQHWNFNNQQIRTTPQLPEPGFSVIPGRGNRLCFPGTSARPRY